MSSESLQARDRRFYCFLSDYRARIFDSGCLGLVFSEDPVSGSDFTNRRKSRARILKTGSRHLGESRILPFYTPHTMAKNLKDTKLERKLAADLSHLAHCYVSSYRPSAADLKKHKVLKELRKNRNLVILKPDKGKSVVVLDRLDYDNGILKIISDTSKFRPIKDDPTLLREGRLQRLLRKLKNSGHLDNDVYNNIYPKGSQPARIYGLPKMHKEREPGSIPPFRPIVSSIGTYNYNLSKYLCGPLTPYIPSEHCAMDTFSFVRDIQDVPMYGKFFVSFDVESLFTNIPLEECIDLAVKYILKGNPDTKLSDTELRDLFSVATAQTHFLFNGSFYDQIDGVAMPPPPCPCTRKSLYGTP